VALHHENYIIKKILSLAVSMKTKATKLFLLATAQQKQYSYFKDVGYLIIVYVLNMSSCLLETRKVY